ncbi:cupin domain-containing protein [Chloroflexota bacterium]
MERIDTYRKWLDKEGMPVITGHGIADVTAVSLKPWPRKGGRGAYINLVGCERITDAYICEMPPGQSPLPQRHLYEELIYILSGNGTTTVWVNGRDKQSFEWQEGSLFSPPLNTWHQHSNAQSDRPAKYIGVTRAPAMMNLFHDLDFIFNNDFVFKDRYNGTENYFSSQGEVIEDLVEGNRKIWDSNFIPDCRNLELAYYTKRGGLSANMFLELSNGMMSAHVSELSGGAYLRAHYHGAGDPHLFLSGQGYALIWPEAGGIMAEGVERIRIDLQKNSLFVAPERWFDQRFSTGKEPLKYLAFHTEQSVKYAGLRKGYEGTKSVKIGGTQIDYEDEDPEIRRLFKEELARTGVSWRMSQYFPGE